MSPERVKINIKRRYRAIRIANRTDFQEPRDIVSKESCNYICWLELFRKWFGKSFIALGDWTSEKGKVWIRTLAVSWERLPQLGLPCNTQFPYIEKLGDVVITLYHWISDWFSLYRSWFNMLHLHYLEKIYLWKEILKNFFFRNDGRHMYALYNILNCLPNTALIPQPADVAPSAPNCFLSLSGVIYHISIIQ